jgi:hypothetical protein
MNFRNALVLTVDQALEHYEDLTDIKRVIVHTAVLQLEVRSFRSNYPFLNLHVAVACQLLQSSDH